MTAPAPRPGETVAVAFLDPGHWSAGFGMSYRDLCMVDLTGPQRFMRPGGSELRSLCPSGAVAASRTAAVRTWLDKTSDDWLWFVDTDMTFPADVLEQLLAAADPADRPVVGGLCFGLRRAERGPLYAERSLIQPTIYRWVDTGDEVGFRTDPDYPRDQVVGCSGTGAACLLIHRDAAYKVRAQYGDAWFTPIIHPSGDHGAPREFSEDLSFCVRLAAVGIPVHVDTRIKTAHDKGGLWLDEETFAHQQMAALALDRFGDGNGGGDGE